MKFIQIGIESKTNNWTLSQWETAGKRIQANGYDTVIFKVMDGAPAGDNPAWYTTQEMVAIHDTLLSTGLAEAIPYTFSYGNADLGNTIHGDLLGEIAFIAATLQRFGKICIDMESHWNGHADYAELFVSHMTTQPGTIYVSTWANPVDQNFIDVIKTLQSEVNAWMPQVYTPYLLSVWQKQWATINAPLILIPTYKLETLPPNKSGDYGIWEYQDLPVKESTLMTAPTNNKHEVANIVPCTQFEIEQGSGVWESEFECGEFAAAMLWGAVQPGATPLRKAEEIDQRADYFYTKYIGPNVASNTMGTSIQVMHDMINENGQHYQDLTAINPNSQQASDIAQIKAALGMGYLIAATITETSVEDLDRGGNPYQKGGWNPSGTHIVVYSGISPDGNLLVEDSANIVGPIMSNNTLMPQPRRYNINKIGTQWACMVKTSWLPAIPQGYDPVKGPPLYPVSAPPVATDPHQLQAMHDEWGALIPGLDINSGIGKSYQGHYTRGDLFPGSPTGHERNTVEWGTGKVIVVQPFEYCKCFWDGKAHWRGLHGLIIDG